jgi:hypothetical protein
MPDGQVKYPPGLQYSVRPRRPDEAMDAPIIPSLTYSSSFCTVMVSCSKIGVSNVTGTKGRELYIPLRPFCAFVTLLDRALVPSTRWTRIDSNVHVLGRDL